MSTPSPGAERNLIFGLLAVQMDFVTREQLLDAMAAWMLDKQTPLGEILCRRGVLGARQARTLDMLVEMHVEQHGNPQASLAALRVEPSVRRDLGQIDDPEVQASLAGLPSQDSPATAEGKPDDSCSALPTTAPVGDAALSIRFRRLREHAKGGLGEVFVALDTDLDREVALKEIQARHADHAESRARFLTEARVTGALEHPGIVPVYGLGVYPDGRPYYAMRFIKGDSLRDAIAAFHAPQAQGLQPLGFHSLAFRQLLRRFVDVCNAIAYAHDKGVIHRDLKPANVMLGKFGETLVVDWGLAKVVGQADVEATTASALISSGDSAWTQAGQALGTPAFMSPEQAAGRLDRVGPASDTYSLGATLYCLLTGKAPFAEKDVGVVLAKVQKGDFKPPRQINASVPPPLEAVCLKAMALKPQDRYSSPRELAEEIEHWLADEPVKAYPEPRRARLARWGRRHKPLVAGAAGLLLTAVVALSLGLVLLGQANTDLAAKNAELADEQVKVQTRFDMAVKAIETIHTGVSEEALLKNPQLKDLRTNLLKKAAGFYADLEKLLAGQSDAKSRKTLAAAYFQLAELTEKIGSQPEALAVHRKGLAVRRELAAAPGADVETRLDVARSLRMVGRLRYSTGDWAGALRDWQEMRAIAASLEPESPTDAVRQQLALSQNNIGTMLDTTGKPAEALEVHRKALAIRQKLVDDNPANNDFHNDLAQSHDNIGHALLAMGKLSEALAAFCKALAIRQKLVDDNAANNDFHNDLALSHDNIGWTLLHMGKPGESLKPSRKALAIYQRLVDDNPANIGLQRGLADLHNNIGEALRETGKLAEALAVQRKALATWHKLVDANAANNDFQAGLGGGHNCMGLVLESMGKPTEALEAYRKALAILQKVVHANPANTDCQIELAWCHNKIGRAYSRQKRFAEAFTALDAGLAIRQKLIETDPNNIRYIQALGTNYAYHGGARARAGQPAEAAADLRRARELWAKLPNLDIEFQVERSRALALLAGLGGDAKSGVTKEESRTFAELSVAALADAVKSGWALPSELKEPDFDALRGRDDFKKLLTQVEAKSGPKAKAID